MGRPRTPNLLTLALTGVLGCPCPSLDDATVEDPFDLATADEEEEIRQAMEDFAAWTGVSDLCIHGVKVRWIPYADAGGLFKPDTDWVIIDPVNLGGITETTHHELCHAWDNAMGRISQQLPDLFPPSDVERSDLYPNDERRSAESFALACETPSPIGLEAGLEQACGFDLLDDKARWVMDNVYVNYQPEWRYRGATAVGLDKVDIAFPFSSAWDFGASDDSVVGIFYDRLGYWGYALHNGLDGPPRMARDIATIFSPTDSVIRVIELDPDTGAAISSVSITEITKEAEGYPRLFAGPGGPLLVAVFAEDTRAWRVDTRLGTLTELPFPHLKKPPLAGVVSGDRAWLMARPVELGTKTLIEVDLQTGAWHEIDLLHEPLRWKDEEVGPMVVLGQDLLIARNSENEGARIIRYHPDTQAVDRTRVSEETVTVITNLAVLGDGRWVLSLEAELPGEEDAEQRDMLLIHDPEDSTWTMEPTTCHAGWATAMKLLWPWKPGTFMTVGDQVYYPGQEADYSPLMIHLDIPPR